jgi:hypothetical protein
MNRTSTARLALIILALAAALPAASAGTIYPVNYSFEADNTNVPPTPGDAEGAQYPSGWTFYCPQDDFVQYYAQFVDVVNQPICMAHNSYWPAVAGITSNQYLWMFGGGVSPQVTQVLGAAVQAGWSYQLEVDFAVPFGAPSGVATITLSANGPTTYPTLSDPNNILSPMVLADGGGMLLASAIITGGELSAGFGTFSTNLVLADPSLVGQPLTVSIAVDPDGTTGRSNGSDNWFIDNVRIEAVQSLMPGDANGDGTVNISDLSVLLTNFDKTGMSWSQGDFDGNGTVDIADLSKLLTNFDKTSRASAGIQAVPEPGALPLLAAVFVGLLACGLAKTRTGKEGIPGE